VKPVIQVSLTYCIPHREGIVKFREGWMSHICYDYDSPRSDGDETVLAARSMVSLRATRLSLLCSCKSDEARSGKGQRRKVAWDTRCSFRYLIWSTRIAR